LHTEHSISAEDIAERFGVRVAMVRRRLSNILGKANFLASTFYQDVAGKCSVGVNAGLSGRGPLPPNVHEFDRVLKLRIAARSAACDFPAAASRSIKPVPSHPFGTRLVQGT
jgi:hypothetical protein